MASVTAIETPEVERQIVADMARRALMVAPAVVVVSALVWGVDGALSSAYALVIVLVNFALSAAVLRRAARMSPTTVMAAVMGGFLVRMILVLAAITVAGHFSWVAKVPLGLTVVVTHLGLLIWEAKYLSVSLAFPALKPKGDT